MKKNNANFHTIIILIFAISFGFSSSIEAQGWFKKYTDSILLNTITSSDITQDGGMIILHRIEENSKVIKLDIDGEKQWENTYSPGPHLYLISDKIIQTKDGGYILAGAYSITSAYHSSIVKIDALGNEVWRYDLVFSDFSEMDFIYENDNEEIICIGRVLNEAYFAKFSKNGNLLLNHPLQITPSGPNNMVKLADLKVNPDKTYSVSYTYYSNPVNNSAIMILDDLGNIISTKILGNGIDDFRVRDHDVYPNGDYLAHFLLVYSHYFGRFDSLGNEIWKTLVDTSKLAVVDVELSNTNEIYACGPYRDPSQGQSFNPVPTIQKLDSLGNNLWFRRFPGLGTSDLFDIDVASDGSCYSSGIYSDGLLVPFNFVAGIKLSNDGNLYSAWVKGNITLDKNSNCIADVPDVPADYYGVLIDGQHPQIAYTDQNGDYFMNVDTGNYVLSTIQPGSLYNSCSGSVPVTLTFGDTTVVDFVEEPLAECTHMFVDVSTPRLVRCRESTYSINYCNFGTIDAHSVSVEVTFDAYLHVLSSSIPWISQNGTTYTFLLDTVKMMECNDFTVQIEVDCDSTVLGQTHCVEAHIYPDSICLPPSPNWDGSITTLNAACVQDSVLLEIENTGTGGMTLPQNYIIAEDNIIRTAGATYQLPAAQKTSFKYLANGKTYRLTADQAPGYFPAGYKPTIAIEGCGFDSITMQYSLGFITQYAENDVMDYLSIDCQENQGPYDPNDKHAEPKGYGPQHYIEQNTDLEYHIRFQNVGTDTAYSVVIRDTLSPHLNRQSIQLGASSHPFCFRIVNGNVMKFVFEDIKLVDSTTNEAGSHGFVKFRIAQQPNLPLGTVINNSAAIYFDYNEPVITNTTFHEIGEDFVEVILSTNENPTDYPLIDIAVYPNPFVDQATIEVKNGPQEELLIVIYDSVGKKISQNQFTNSYRLNRKQFSSGVYHFSILSKGKLLGNGKIIAM